MAEVSRVGEPGQSTDRDAEQRVGLGLLSRFIGMLTDSRSFMSYPRHEYFRRVLCNLLGRDMESGMLPNSDGLVGPMVKNICYQNARQYLGLDVQ